VIAKDFHIKANSPCINAGSNLALAQDYDGAPLKEVANPSIGAFQF
jgi:hypothetical protein